MSLSAVIKTGGKQYLVKEGDLLRIEKLDKKVGDKISFKDVLLRFDPKKKTGAELGKPTLKTVKVEAEIVSQGKNKKVKIIKYKPKIRYHRDRGHRQLYTQVKILSVGSEKKPAAGMSATEKKSRE